MATNWITIDTELVQGRMAGPELTAYTTAALAEGQTGSAVLADCIAQVVDKARGYCVTAIKNGHLRAMGPSGTVPARMLLPVLNIIRYELATRLPRMNKLIDELRQKQHDKDCAFLEGVAKGMPSMEDPDEPETQATAPSPSIKARCKRYGREAQEGV